VKRLAPIHLTQGPAIIVGPALIDAGDDPGIIIENAGDVTIKDIIIRGNGRTHNQNGGIRIENSTDRTLSNVFIDNVEVSGFKEDGILVYANAQHGYSNIKIANCRSHDNGRSGITVRAEAYPATPHSDVSITNCVAYQNTGIPGLPVHTGSGIVMSGFRRGLIQFCEAYQNGALCDATESGGPVGIWAYNCDEGIIQYNISHHNHSNNHADGGGFDLDGGSTNSVLRYNLSYYNDGYGFQLWDFFWGETTFNRICKNISWYDCQKYDFGAFSVFGKVMSSSIYSNFARIKEGASGIKLQQWTGAELIFADNIYLADGIAQHFVITDTTARPMVMRDSFIVSKV
jgi:hypothetical protein